MRLLDLICKELEVEVDEHWKGSDGRTYVIDEVGQLHYYNENSKAGGYINANEIIPKLIIGELKPKWKPVKDESYYYPRIDFRQGYAYTTWEGDSQDIYRFTNNLVFKTKKEAVEVADKMLESLKEE